MFWGVISVLSSVVAALLSSAGQQPSNTGVAAVGYNPANSAVAQPAEVGNVTAPQAPAAQSLGAPAAQRPHAPAAQAPRANAVQQFRQPRRGSDAGRASSHVPVNAGPAASAAGPAASAAHKALHARGYCEAGGGCDEYIARVQIGGIDNSSGCDQYHDYTELWTLAVPGEQYPITVTNGTAYSSDVCSIWVDWNQDETFEDDGPEWIGDQVGGGISPPYSLTVTVPTEGVLSGYTRMRIRIDYLNPDPDPCGTTTYGEVEDYSLLVAGEEPGACCNVYDGTCQDGVTALGCSAMGAAWHWHYQQMCATLDPPCGDPGCCCDWPEPGYEVAPHPDFRANCAGRFLSGVTGGECVAEAFTPACGTWNQTPVLYAPAWNDNPGFRAALSTVLGSDVDYWNAAMVGTPPLETMRQYAVVMTWVNYPYADAVGMGDTLADYVDRGGRVILGQWCRHTDQSNYLSGRIMDDPAYCPVLACSTSFGSGAYGMDGVACVHSGPFGEVGWHDTQYLDVVSTVAPGASVDGTIDGSISAISTFPGNIWYSPGFTGTDYGSGDWVTKIANMIECWIPPSGACCNLFTGECIDYTDPLDCSQEPEWHWHWGGCADLQPPCGNPGACCDIHTGACIDDVLEANCDPGSKFTGGVACGELDPPCGDLGCCCGPDGPYESLFVDCEGRFLSGVVGEACVPEAFYPPCDGSWTPAGMLYAPSWNDNPAFRAAVEALIGPPVDYWNAYTSGTPTLMQLQEYAAVFTWCNYPYADPVAMGNVLADYVDQGGRVILGQWTRHGNQSNYLQGRIMSDPSYCPVLTISNSFGSGSYNMDGVLCPHYGPHGTVGAHSTQYLDVVSTLAPGATADGTIDGSLDAVWNATGDVYYSPGNLGGEPSYTSGDWARLTANMVECGGPPLYGACCDPEMLADPDDPFLGGVCTDDTLSSTCATSGHQFFADQLCAELNPVCGTPGACCYDWLGECEDTLMALCWVRFEPGVRCADLDPPCGTPPPPSLLYAPTQPDNPSFRSAVSALLGGWPVDYFDARVSTPTLSQLSDYSAVFTWVNYAYADNVAMGDVLADFVDIGGKVILGQWCLPSAGNYLSGRIMTPEYCPATISLDCTPGPYTPGSICPSCELSGTYIDPVDPQPGAISDGLFGTCPALVFWPDMSVFYSPGNAPDFSGGDWAMFTASMVMASGDPGACCNVTTGECQDDVEAGACRDMGVTWRPHPNLTCDELFPPCGNPGACCNVYTGVCLDDIFAANCDYEDHGGWACGELITPCGDPGCCCDRPEPGVITEPHFAFAANCSGRFISGAFTLCGDLDESGVVDMSDYNMFLDAFGKCTGQPGFNAAADLDGDGCVTLVDFQTWRNCYQFQGTDCTAEAFEPECGLESISVDTSVGTAAPPPDLCGATMIPFEPDPRPLYADVTSLPTPFTIPGEIGLSSPFNHRRIGSGWMSWSHGYTGDVYYSNGAISVTLTMPIGASAVYFYVEPNPFAQHTFELLVNGTYLSDPFTAHGSAGAAYVGVCGNPVATIVLTCISGVDFAIGEFGISHTDVEGACCDEPGAVCTEALWASDCSVIPDFRFAPLPATCADFDPPCGQVYGACCYDETCAYERPSECGGEYAGDGVPCDPNPCLCYDAEMTAPGTWTGTTVGAGDDCALRAGQDVIIKVEIPTDGNWQFDVCASSPGWDTYMYLGTDCCQSTWSNDDGCPSYAVLSIIQVSDLTAGTYYVDIEPFSSSAAGPVTLTVANYEPGDRTAAPHAARASKRLKPHPESGNWSPGQPGRAGTE
jgi:hypothetical protein